MKTRTSDDELFENVRVAVLVQLKYYLTLLDKQDVIQENEKLFEDIPDTETGEAYHIEFLTGLEKDSTLAETRLHYLMDRKHMGHIGQMALMICLCDYKHTDVSQFLCKLFGKKSVDYDMAVRIATVCFPTVDNSYDEVHKEFDRVKCYLDYVEGNLPYEYYELDADERLIAYLCCSDTIDKCVQGTAELFFQDYNELYSHQEQLQYVIHHLGDVEEPNHILQIQGQTGIGKGILIKKAIMQYEIPMVIFDWSKAQDFKGPDIEYIAKKVAREALFYRGIVCVRGLTYQNIVEDDKREFFITKVLTVFWEQDIKTVLLTEEAVTFYPYCDFNFSILSIPKVSREERLVYWESFCKQHEVKSKINFIMAATNYQMVPSEIERAVRYIKTQERYETGKDKDVNALLADACYSAIDGGRDGSIKRVETNYTMEDIKLPQEQKNTLQKLCNHITYQHQVFDTWEMQEKYEYGRNVSALFTGPPGTGKTMAVRVLANQIHMHLYHVNLSQVVDKYIGETEKKLDAIFETAEKSNVILFFDEADSIFGKRSEVNDSKDKYANTEVSYILQRIEEYSGIVILATNYRKNIDEAFMRRIRYVVEFHLPGVDIREELWRGAFTDKAPKDSLDYAYLARQFELSGGSIKNIVLNASFAAAGEGKNISMLHILQAVQNENSKYGKVMIASDFGEYAPLLQEI